MPTTMLSAVPHPMQLSNLATAVRMRSQEGSSPLSSPIQKPAPNRKPRKKRVDLHGKLEAMSEEPLADLLRAQTQPWTPEEDHLIVQMVERVGHKWSAIATLLPGRTDNGVRNRWNRLDRCEHTHGTLHPLTSQQPPPSAATLSPLHTLPHSHRVPAPHHPTDSSSLDTPHTSHLTPHLKPSRRLKHLMHVSPQSRRPPRLIPRRARLVSQGATRETEGYHGRGGFAFVPLPPLRPAQAGPHVPRTHVGAAAAAAAAAAHHRVVAWQHRAAVRTVRGARPSLKTEPSHTRPLTLPSP